MFGSSMFIIAVIHLNVFYKFALGVAHLISFISMYAFTLELRI